MSVRAPFELDATAARGYLASRGEPLGPAATVRELGGGVSNTVLYVADQGRAFVIKQALPQLRVQDEWLADRGRILRERDALVAAAELLPAGWVPRVLWSDEENFIYAMEACCARRGVVEDQAAARRESMRARRVKRASRWA